MNLGGPELLIIAILLVDLVALAFIIWGAVDASSQPDWAWQQTGRSKLVWIVVTLVRWLVVCGISGSSWSSCTSSRSAGAAPGQGRPELTSGARSA